MALRKQQTKEEMIFAKGLDGDSVRIYCSNQLSSGQVLYHADLFLVMGSKHQAQLCCNTSVKFIFFLKTEPITQPSPILQHHGQPNAQGWLRALSTKKGLAAWQLKLHGGRQER